VGERVAKGYALLLAENLPFSTFRNRASFPLVLSSLRIAEYKVACGVSPPGLDQDSNQYDGSIDCGERLRALRSSGDQYRMLPITISGQ
jgi:hypothetical protein